MKTKVKIVLIVFILALLGILVSTEMDASEGYVPGKTELGPNWKPACACDYYPNDCWCAYRN